MNLKIENGVLSGDWKYPENDITEIIIPEEVTSIETFTFMNWQNLRLVQLPSGLKGIRHGAFEGCEALEEAELPEHLEFLESSVFWGCISLKEMHLPEHVSRIGYGAFAGCCELHEISVSEKNPYFTAVDGVLYDKNITELYCCPAGKKSISIPETVTKIRKFAFCHCHRLKEIHIPPAVKHIQYGAFRGCTGLSEILIPATVLQCENPNFPEDTLVSVEGKTGVMQYYPEEARQTSAELVLERNFSVSMNRQIKYDLIFRMLFAGISGAETYVKKNFPKMFKSLIDSEDTEKIQKILDTGKFISKRNISTFIRYADENSHSDCWEILYHYKEEHLS